MFLILIFYLIILFNFNNVFNYFHLISFNNNYWLLNPEADNLIKMFPEKIFFDLARTAILYSFILSLIILIFSILTYRHIKKHYS